MPLQVTTILIGVKDLARSKKFYGEGLGCMIDKDYPTFVSINLGEGSSKLSLYEWETAAQDAGVSSEGSGFETIQAIQTILKATREGGVPQKTLELVHLRVSQLNGCSFCVDSGARSARRAGETDERLFAVAAWREAPYFTDAERATFALAEAATRLADRSDPVPDSLWEEVARHYDEKGLGAIVIMIATTNFFNRINVTPRKPAGSGW